MKKSDLSLAHPIRMLAADAVQRASSGHPGMPMGMADIATVLWREFLAHNPTDPNWHNRDRFILSNGHGSMLQYALLHLSGYDLSMEEIKNFRQMNSQTPGHPELETVGVETTTGPLGHGLANAVGMALAERNLAAEFNLPELNIVSHFTYVFAGDGCLMEGLSHEACSLAGTQRLNKLICFFDDNGISIDGEVSGWCSDDVAKRFDAYNWNVLGPIDGHDHEQIRKAITSAQQSDKPSLIICKTHIGYGSPNKADKAAAHGAPLGDEEIALMRSNLDWQHEPFVITDEIYQAWNMRDKGKKAQQQWEDLYAKYSSAHPTKAKEYTRRLSGQMPHDFTNKAQDFIISQHKSAASVASRQSSLQAINNLLPSLPELLGGSADLSGSNCTLSDSSVAISDNGKPGNYIYYGVRELAMSSIMNGIALHGGYIPYGGTFLVFLDYSRSAVRLAALMRQKVIFIFSHDSIGVGEDGPTHQPIEHLTMLRATPGIDVWRPADTVECAVAWTESLQKSSPSTLILSRQNLEFQSRDESQLEDIAKGGYVLVAGGNNQEGNNQGGNNKGYNQGNNNDEPAAIVIATGSELGAARQAVEQHNKEDLTKGGNKQVRLVSMPCCEVFDAQSPEYRDKVLPPKIVKRLAIEAAMPDYWHRYIGLQGEIIGINSFGKSAPASELFEHFGLTAKHIYNKITAFIHQ